MLQIDLFGQDAFRQRRRAPGQGAAPAAGAWVQLDLLGTAWLDRPDEEADDPLIAAPIVHRIVLALEAEPPQTTGVRSIFDLAVVVQCMPARPEKPEAPRPERYGVTTREAGVIRHTARRYDETEEWAEKERQRRARQRVPKPVKRARTRGAKLLDLIGREETET